MRIYTVHFILPKVKSFFLHGGVTYMCSTYKCMHVRSKLMWVSSSIPLHCIFFSLSPLSLVQLSGSSQSSLSSPKGHHASWLYVGIGICRSHIYMVNTLSTKPSPQPPKSLSNLEPFMMILSHILHEEQNTWKMGGRHGKLTMAITRKQKEVLHISYFISGIFSQN